MALFEQWNMEEKVVDPEQLLLTHHPRFNVTHRSLPFKDFMVELS